VHRSGRTARANQSGTAVSFISPEDISHHNDICNYLGMKHLSPLSIYPHSLPLLRQRVKLAKQVLYYNILLIVYHVIILFIIMILIILVIVNHLIMLFIIMILIILVIAYHLIILFIIMIY